ncbi:MAG: response regulator [Planctomycetes bacterium]|nr:response regulator [Planctomycetota bacterium]
MTDNSRDAKKVVLIVEDEALIRWSLQQRLEEEGLTVLQAADAQAALDYVSHDGICGVLLDLRLPDGSGLDVLREFRKRHTDCPAWIMTAYGTPDAEQEANVLGVNEFISKPFDIEELVQKVLAAL